MNENFYKKDFKGSSKIAKALRERSDLRQVFFDFLEDFKYYLKEYIRESAFETGAYELAIGTQPIKLVSDDCKGVHLTLKNQGKLECYLSTAGRGGFRLDPGEKERIWLTKPMLAVTISGSTTLGLIRS